MLSDSFEIESNPYIADCENCFGLCCVALPYAKSADFAFDKSGGTPCTHLRSDYRCSIHPNLRKKGLRGCTVYDCFGAGQKVSKVTYQNKDWREYPELAGEMYEVFPIMQQLYEILYYLNEAIHRKEAESLYFDLQDALNKTKDLTNLKPELILSLHVSAHRAMVNELFLKTSKLVRAKFTSTNKRVRKNNLIGAKLKGADLKGSNLRGVLLIASDLRNADLRACDFIGADLRDADLSGANLLGSLFLTQAQINSANGDIHTKLPATLKMPEHWLNK